MNTISNYYYLEQIQQRNPIIFNKIYREYKDKIYTFLLLKTNGNIQIAEEIICDTFHSAIESAPKLKNLNNIQAWLMQIATRRLNDYLRKKYTEKKYFKNIEMENIICNDFIDDSIQKEYEKIIINKVYNDLKYKYKELLKLKYIEKLSIKEISKLLGFNISKTNSLLSRARKSFKIKFKMIINNEKA